MLYIGIVAKTGYAHSPLATKHNATVGADKTAVIAECLARKTNWEKQWSNYGPYEIIIGELTDAVVIPTPKFELVPLKV